MILEISANNILSNVESAKNRLRSAGLIAVVKDNAYGHGALNVARLIRKRVDGFAVASEDEARELTDGGVTERIIILGGGFIKHRCSNNVIPTVSSADEVVAAASKCSEVAIAVNGGMNRFGCEPSEFGRLKSYAESLGLRVSDAYAHMSDPTDINRSKAQLNAFLAATNGFNLKRHAAATCALGLGKEFVLDAVRLGIGLYGYGASDLISTTSAYARVECVRSLKKGDYVGYGAYRLERDAVIAIVGAGYGDGLKRSAKSHTAYIGGVKCRSVGRICMDCSFFDVTGTNCKRGDKAYFLGGGIGMDEVCEAYDTIPHEILTSFSLKSERIFV